MTRRVLSVVLTVVLAAGLVACGEKDERGAGAAPGPNERVDLLLDYLPNADHAGIYAAIGSGEFKTAALDVRPRTPSDPSLPLKLLAAGKTDLAISYEPELLLARAKGAKLVSIGALVQKPLTSIVSLGDKAIKQPTDLAGKTVGTAGIPYQDAYLKTILGGAGVDIGKVKAVNVGFNLVPALVSKRVDAVLGMFWNVEGVQLARQDRKPEILRVDALGVPTYNELIIVAREQDVRSRGPLLRRFMRALARGHALLRANVDAGVDPLVKAEPDLDPALQRAQVKATLPVFFPLDGKRPFG
ncbi:MAG: putative hydroxymethylpyrimidine transport system substrate-binding protein, partial [Solirubrobacteraceae bacterium]|nr:putative hydroxymethylpyrimidine transport system substrate-binding protein [Solirubrobacteraceae bacterium]